MSTIGLKTSQQYLREYSQAISLKDESIDHNWDHVLIVPVCGESPAFFLQLLQHHPHQSVLVLMLVNRPDGHDKSAQWQQENQILLNYVTQQAKEIISISECHNLCIDCQGMDVMLLNFNEQPFPAKKGVGLARRIAADTALALINMQVINHPWIYSTDADAVLPVGYFDVVKTTPENSPAISLAFEHFSDQQAKKELQNQYDFKLLYYQKGMRFMGSKYDYIPLGSTLIIKAMAYAQVRGFPCRSGGEDFYILNKLAKLGPVNQPETPVVCLKIRLSDRVPFGTGPALIQILNQARNGMGVTYYHPQIFHVLKDWQQALLYFYESQRLPINDCGLNKHWKVNDVLQKALKQCHTAARWRQFIHEWFDAFRVLKSVHWLRAEFPSIEHHELLHLSSYKEIDC